MTPNTAKQIWLVLKPSWLSGLIAGLGSVILVGGVLVVSNYQGSRLQQEIFEAKGVNGKLPGTDFQIVTGNLAHNQVINNLPLFLFWALLGFVVYFFAVNLWGLVANAEQMREQLDYVNTSRRQVIRNAVVRLGIRLLVLVGWVAYLQLCLKVLLPYVLAVSHVAAVDLLSVQGGAYTVLALAVTFCALQFHTVLLRLFLLKVRAFGDPAL